YVPRMTPPNGFDANGPFKAAIVHQLAE
ncbi:MAG: hypothetical protein CFH05_00995, partial [Alphaproteobacteria bacterium MarineAlpha3_Bin4]